MAKKAKTAPSIPEIYHGLTRDASRQHNCIVEDVHHAFFRFNSPAENHIVTAGVHKVWPNFNKFADEPKQTLLAYHAELFKAEPPKDQDLVSTALYCWFKLCDIATDRTAKPATDVVTGKKSTISTRKYFLGSEPNPTAHIKTPQANACFKIFTETLAKKQEKDTKDMPEDVKKTYVPHLTEAELKAVIIERAAELRTRQDPWRIFQYYRPTLISVKALKTD